MNQGKRALFTQDCVLGFESESGRPVGHINDGSHLERIALDAHAADARAIDAAALENLVDLAHDARCPVA